MELGRLSAVAGSTVPLDRSAAAQARAVTSHSVESDGFRAPLHPGREHPLRLQSVDGKETRWVGKVACHARTYNEGMQREISDGCGSYIGSIHSSAALFGGKREVC